MKKIFSSTIAILAILTGTSCNKNVGTPVVNQKAEKALICLNIDADLVTTKANIEDTADEAKLNSIQVFVFNEKNDVDAYKLATAEEITAKRVVLEGTVGKREVYVIANAPADRHLENITNKANLEAAVSELTRDNTSSSFVMGGKLSAQNVTASFSQTVKVDRYAARVKIHKITRSFTNPALGALDFKIVRIFLSDVNETVRYDFGDAPQYKWLNSYWNNNGAMSVSNKFVYKKLPTAQPLANNNSYNVPTDLTSFYAYPNRNAARVPASGTATGEQTKLVVHCLIGGEDYYYPVPLGRAVESNRSYEINELVITRLGNAGNDDDVVNEEEVEPIIPSNMSFTISVNDWNGVPLGPNSDGIVRI